MQTEPAKAAAAREPAPLLKLIIELGPLLLFFFANARFGIMVATGAFMVAITVALAVNYYLTGRLSPVPLFTALLVVIFGGLTLYLQDETFIKVKPTLVNLLFAAILGGGLIFGRLFLKVALGAMVDLTDTGWRGLTWRWIGFFIAMALLNEAVWRNVSTDSWVSFKVFALLPLTVVFALAQTPYLQRHTRLKKIDNSDR